MVNRCSSQSISASRPRRCASLAAGSKMSVTSTKPSGNPMRRSCTPRAGWTRSYTRPSEYRARVRRQKPRPTGPPCSRGRRRGHGWARLTQPSLHIPPVEAAMATTRTYLPAAGHDWFLPLYDPFVKLVGGDRARRALLEQAEMRPGQRVLDVGCGTGSLAVMIKRLRSDVDVVGLDPDPKALARARQKAEREGASIRLDRGFSDKLPYPAASFDLVFSSLMFHHLPAEEKGGDAARDPA